MKPGHILAGFCVTAAMRLVSLLPLPVSQACGKLIGWCIYLLNARAAKVTATNIDVCMPHLSNKQQAELARRSLLHTGQMLMETPAAWLGQPDRIGRWIRQVENESLFEAALAARQGVIVLLPHIGNWELVNVYMASRGSYVTGLYAPPNKAWLKGIMAEVRSRFGNELVPTSIKGIATLYRRLNEGKIVVILPDQVPASGGFAPFFGVQALTDKLIPRLLERTNARVVCCVIRRLPRAKGFDALFSDPDPEIYAHDPMVSLAALNRSIENCVRQAPDQYQWEYKRFKERPVGKLRLYNYKNEPWTHH